MTTILLAIVGALEAIVHLWRYRSANRDNPASSAMSAGCVQALRVTGIGGIAASVGSGDWLLPAVAYTVSPVLVTYWAHVWLRPKGVE